MKHLVLRNSFWGIAASMIAMTAAVQPGSAQCVPGLGGSSAQFTSQDWSRRLPQEITAFQVGSTQITLQRPTQLAADKSGSVYVLDAATNLIFQTTGAYGPSGLPNATYSFYSLPTVTQIRYTAGFLWALTKNGYLITPFLSPSARNYTRLRVSPNSLVDVTFDGQYLWVSDNSNSLYKILPPTIDSAASLAGTLSVANEKPGMLAFDGQHVWAVNNYQLVEIDTASGNILNAVVLPDTITSLTFDGLYFWTGGKIRGDLTKVDALNHQIATSYPAMVPYTQDLVFDGTLVWMPNSAAHALTTVRACDGAINSVSLPASPSNLAFDGNSVWITYRDSPSVSIR